MSEILFGRYRLVERAGTGGTAHVWRAVDERSGETVAVKRLHPLVVADEGARVRLVREFRALRSLADPTIVGVRDLEIGPREAALILEFVPGPSLAERLSTGPPILQDEALAIVADVARALDVAHGAGILHRDVTPANVLLDPELGARLTDFGIARGAEDATAVTAVGTVVGTFGYLAPERLRGDEATAASDIYALGALAWQLLAGRPPFDATTPIGLAREIEAGPPPLDGYAPAVDAVVRCAMAPAPAARPTSASRFAGDLAAAIADGGDAPAVAEARTVALPVVPTEAPPAHGITNEPDHAGASVAPRRPARDAARRTAAVIALGGLLAALAVMAASSPSPTEPAHGTSAAPATMPTPSAAPTAHPQPPQGGGGGAAGGKGHGGGRGKGHG